MNSTQRCAAPECNRADCTYEKPLCHKHWKEWQSYEREECKRCHWICGPEDLMVHQWGDLVPVRAGIADPQAFYCIRCTLALMKQAGTLDKWLLDFEPAVQPLLKSALPTEYGPCPVRVELVRESRYVYVLKCDGGLFYIGQTTDLAVRYKEHIDGLQSQTKGKNPRLVYFEGFQGEREAVAERENELTLLNGSDFGRRKLRKLIEEFRGPLRLVDLDA